MQGLLILLKMKNHKMNVFLLLYSHADNMGKIKLYNIFMKRIKKLRLTL